MARSLILGGGFRGLAAAHLLLTRGEEVTILERGGRLGGVLAGIEWDGLTLDLGCHIFDNTTHAATQFFIDMAGGAQTFHSVDITYATLSSGPRRDGVAIPDFTGLSEAEQARMLLDILKAVAAPQPDAAAPDLSAALTQRYGTAAGEATSEIARKIYACDPITLDPTTVDLGLLRRIRLVPDAIGTVLKRLPELDTRLAVSAVGRLHTLYPDAHPAFARNFYPVTGAMDGFVAAAVRDLQSRGAEIVTNCGDVNVDLSPSGVCARTERAGTFEGERVVSTLSPEVSERVLLGTETLASLIHPVPMVLVYFRVPGGDLGDVDYTHIFDPGRTAFRVSAPSRYALARDADGHGYVCAECPTVVGSDVWNDPDGFADAIWQEAIDAGVAAYGARFVAIKTLRTPRSYTAPKVGYAAAEATLAQDYAALGSEVSVLSSMGLVKLDILSELNTRL